MKKVTDVHIFLILSLLIVLCFFIGNAYKKEEPFKKTTKMHSYCPPVEDWKDVENPQVRQYFEHLYNTSNGKEETKKD